MESLSEI